MSSDAVPWISRDTTIRGVGIVLSMFFICLFFLYLCVEGMSKKRRSTPKPPVFDSDDENMEILRRTSELPDLTPPPAYEVLKEPPPPSYNSVLGNIGRNEI
ncbi:hypothetical protein CRE_14173 [Caenorhabditis remanei]|uniref:Uncharacterized protein n=2 Tax=Caenorhabditis remanei TaxID=31234 RepID=E3N1I1_CAERE|nr:hypothetical protein CRE_14173 [Caenorhabditis remanei]